MSGRGLTAEEVAAKNPVRAFVADVLREEQARGHVEEIDGQWRATEALVETFANAFSYLGPSRPENERRQI